MLVDDDVRNDGHEAKKANLDHNCDLDNGLVNVDAEVGMVGAWETLGWLYAPSLEQSVQPRCGFSFETMISSDAAEILKSHLGLIVLLE